MKAGEQYPTAGRMRRFRAAAVPPCEEFLAHASVQVWCLSCGRQIDLSSDGGAVCKPLPDCDLLDQATPDPGTHQMGPRRICIDAVED
jgi:hypothetical protein